MARPASAAAKRALEDEVDYTSYAGKAPTDLQHRFNEWIVDKVGVEFGTKKEQAAFAEGVRLAVALRMKFQASPENQEALAARAEERETEAVQAAKDTPPPRKSKAQGAAVVDPAEAKPPRRPAKAVKAAVAKAAEPEEDAEPMEAAVKPQRRPARRAASTAKKDDEAPF